MAFFLALGIGIGWLIWAPGGVQFRHNASTTVNGWFGGEGKAAEPEKTNDSPESDVHEPVTQPKTQPDHQPTHPTHPTHNDQDSPKSDPEKDGKDEETVPKLF